MASWAEFGEAAPVLADAGRGLLGQFGPELGFLATLRADGAPRLHPIAPVITGGELWAFVIESSPKCADLRRDGRFALHSFPPEDTDDEFLINGVATEVDVTPSRRAELAAATTASVGREDEVLFSLSVDRAMLATYEARGVFPPRYSIWPAPPAR